MDGSLLLRELPDAERQYKTIPRITFWSFSCETRGRLAWPLLNQVAFFGMQQGWYREQLRPFIWGGGFFVCLWFGISQTK